MSIRELVPPESEYLQTLTAAIFDVDGVLLASPHERAWREALKGFADPDRFTTAMYETHVAGKPRASGARAALEALGVPEAERQAVIYAEKKQKRLEELIHAGSVAAFPDALRFVQAIGALGWPMAVASSSKNANQMMRQIHVDSGRSLLDVFSVNVCGRDLRQGKPNPAIFLLAAAEMRVGAGTLLRGRGRARRHRGGPCGWHDGAWRRPTSGHFPLASRRSGPRGDQPRRNCNR